MCPEDKQEGSIVLPDKVATQRRRDFARVISVGGKYEGRLYDGRRGHDSSIDLEAGDIVLVDYRYGTWYAGFGKNQVRCFGATGGVGSSEDFQRYPVSDAAPVKWIDGMIRPIQDKVLLEVKTSNEKGGIILTRDKVDAVATVVNFGSLVDNLSEGMKVIFHVNEAVGFEGIPEYDKYVVVPRDAIKGLYYGD